MRCPDCREEIHEDNVIVEVSDGAIVITICCYRCDMEWEKLIREGEL